MTADQILKSRILDILILHHGDADSQCKQIISFIKGYAQNKCREQRDNIYDYQLKNHGAVVADVKDSIFNAPEPKFD